MREVTYKPGGDSRGKFVKKNQNVFDWLDVHVCKSYPPNIFFKKEIKGIKSHLVILKQIHPVKKLQKLFLTV